MAENYNIGELLQKNSDDLTVDELKYIISFNAKIAAVKKVAKDKGVIAKKEKAEVSPEFALLASAFEAVLTANMDFIKTLFPVSAEKPHGAKGVNVATTKDCPYYIQILNREAFKADAEAKKAEKAAKTDETAVEKAETE